MDKVLDTRLDLLQKGNSPIDLSIRPQLKPCKAAPPSKARTVDFEMIAVSLFAVFCFVALALCAYIIFANAKANGPSEA